MHACTLNSSVGAWSHLTSLLCGLAALTASFHERTAFPLALAVVSYASTWLSHAVIDANRGVTTAFAAVAFNVVW